MLLYAYKYSFHTIFLIGFIEIDNEIETTIACKKYDDFNRPDKELDDAILKYNAAGVKF